MVGYLADMPNPGRLLWFTDTQQDENERRLLDALSAYRPQASRLTGDEAQFAGLSADDTVVLNLQQYDSDAAERVREIRSLAPRAAVIVRAAAASEGDPEGAGGIGADCILDSRAGTDHAKVRIVEKILQQRGEARHGVGEWRRGLIGDSFAMQKAAEIIRLVGPRKCTVLITGETGTGKEIAARAIHLAGPRASSPFVAVNCSAIPSALLEAELFGHTKGAFTGAIQTRVGRFEEAGAGTLFLDEIGELPLDLQAKLLRVLQEREFQKLGSSETVRANARVIAATNCDIRAKAREGSFREDLLYRLNVVPLELPPLRARRGDIRPLTEHFLAKICREEQLPPKLLTPQAWAALHRHAWPGNVRQLENAVASAVILSEDRRYLEAEDFPDIESESAAPSEPPFGRVELPDEGFDFTVVMNTLERNILAQALRKTGGNKKQAAEMLGLKRTTLSAKVRVLEEGHGLRLT